MNILLFGNGINRAFNDPSWETIIENELKVSGSSFSYKDIENLPATMQIVVATNDNVHRRLTELAAGFASQDVSQERKEFLKRIISVPVDAFLTTNYGFELEKALGFNKTPASYRTKLVGTLNEKDQFRLYKYYPIDENRSLWHMHGDASKPSSMVMGHYWYEKYLREIQNHITRMRGQYHKEDFKPKSWVDYFLMSNIHILGFGIYTCESIFWWLLCCKKRIFPDTKVYLYADCSDERAILFETYGGIIIPLNETNGRERYMKALGLLKL